MTERRAASAASRPPGAGPDPLRRVPFWLAALLLGLAAGAVALVAILAGRAGPLVAHPPTVAPAPPRPVTMPTMSLPTLPSTPPRQQAESSGDWLLWVGAVMGALLLLVVVIWVLRVLRRPDRIAASPIAAVTSPASPLALGWLDEDAEADLTDDRTFDPHRAADDIIASWTAAETIAGRLGSARPPASTPTEFLQAVIARFGDVDLDEAEPRRIGGRQMLGPVPVSERWTASTVLLRLYQRARFDTDALAPGAATAARAAARALISRWRARPASESPTEAPDAAPDGRPDVAAAGRPDVAPDRRADSNGGTR